MELATIITAFAALITGITSLCIVMEMKRQRIAISKPVIKLIANNFEAVFCKGTWTWRVGNDNFAKLSIFNFGAGPAINIIVKWEVDKTKLIKTLKHFDPCNQLKIEWKNDVFICDNSAHFIKNQRLQRIEALPIYQGSNNKKLQIPFYYITGFEKYMQVAFINRPEKSDDDVIQERKVPDYPPIKLTVSYEDINGNKMTQRIILKLSPSLVLHRNDDEGYRISGDIEVIDDVEQGASPDRYSAGAP